MIFAAVYRSAENAIDGVRVLAEAAADEVARPSLMRREAGGRLILQETGLDPVLRAGLVGAIIGFATGMGSRVMWATMLIGALIGVLSGMSDRSLMIRELGALMAAQMPPGTYGVVAVADQDVASRLPEQLELAESTRVLPIASRGVAELARCLAAGNRRVTHALDGRGN